MTFIAHEIIKFAIILFTVGGFICLGMCVIMDKLEKRLRTKLERDHSHKLAKACQREERNRKQW